MKKLRCALLIVLVISLLMSGCAVVKAAEATTPATVPTTPSAVPTTPAVKPTEAPTEPAEPAKFTLAETVLPEADVATGTLKFYVGGQEIYAGGPVATLLATDYWTTDDLQQILQPWHTSSVMRVRVRVADVKEEDEPFVFFVAMNASNEPKKLSECLFYSISINTSTGVKFGSGKEKASFVTGETTRDEIVAAYGEPDYEKSADPKFLEMAYYEPFNCAYFSFNKDVVRQVWTYYSANIFGDLAKDFTHDLSGSYFGNDCYILMNQYMDVAPYLPGAERNAETGIVEALTEKIIVSGNEIAMGISVSELPSPFFDAFTGLEMPVHDGYYLKAGRINEEEFYLINYENGQKKNKADSLTVKGIFVGNNNYANWGAKYGAYHDFQYENLTQDSTIEDILEQYGMPNDMHCTSYARACFAWLSYKDRAGNELHIRVDPIHNQIIELKFSKYFEDEILYK